MPSSGVLRLYWGQWTGSRQGNDRVSGLTLGRSINSISQWAARHRRATRAQTGRQPEHSGDRGSGPGPAPVGPRAHPQCRFHSGAVPFQWSPLCSGLPNPMGPPLVVPGISCASAVCPGSAPAALCPMGVTDFEQQQKNPPRVLCVMRDVGKGKHRGGELG